MTYIKNRINWHIEIGEVQRIEIPEIPIRAIREMVINALHMQIAKIIQKSKSIFTQVKLLFLIPDHFHLIYLRLIILKKTYLQ